MNKFQYQCLDCFIQDTDQDEKESNELEDLNFFTVHTFGKTKEGESVAVHVTGYTPYLYVNYNDKNADASWGSVFELLQKQLLKWQKNDDDSFEIVSDASQHLIDGGVSYQKSIWGYNFDQKIPVYKLYFRSMYAYKKIKNILQGCHGNKLSTSDVQGFYSIASKLPYNEQYKYMMQFSKERDVSINCLRFAIKLGKASLPLQFAKCALYDVVDPILRFAHLKDLKMASWFEIEDYYTPDTRVTSCDLEYTVDYNDINPFACDTICTQIKEMAFDIESYSPTDKFPDANNKEDVVYQIGITLKMYSDKKAKRILLHLAETGRCTGIPSQNVCVRENENLVDLCKNRECLKNGHVETIVEPIVENYTSEKALLLRFQEIISTENPDLIYGYNSDGFDWKYLMIRAQVNNCFMEFCKLSRLDDYYCKVVEKKFQSSAYGDNIYFRVDIPGRLNIDLMIWIQRNMPVDRYPDYKLDTIADIELSQNKHDITFKEIFRAYRVGDEFLLNKIGDYCLQDTILVQKLVNKLDVVTQLFEMANLTSVPVSYLLSKGQQIKVYSIISKDAMLKDSIVPFLDVKSDSSFTGAIVLEPKTGCFQTPIAVLDFASLYPSIQVAYKICYSTIVLDPMLYNTLKDMKSRGQELSINGVRFDNIEWQDDVIKCTTLDGNERIFSNADSAKESLNVAKKDILDSIKSGGGSTSCGTFVNFKQDYLFFFAQNTSSIIPDLQVVLKQSRKNVRKMMGLIENSDNVEDLLRYRVLNGRQLAIKVTMNSIYGFTSAFMLNLSSLSACVTAKGRQMIEMTKNFMENDFGNIAKQNMWTVEDTSTYYNDIMKEVVTDEPRKGWIRKFPTAVAGQPWSSEELNINVVGGDTDSVFCNFPNSSLEQVISLNHKAEVILTDKIFNRHPIEMEYEKTYYPMVIVKKKNYIGVKYEMNPNKWKIDYKGIAIKRRNYCSIVKRIYWDVIYPVLGVQVGKDGKLRKVDWEHTQGPERALEQLNNSLQELFLQDNPSDYNNFIIYASLKSSYKSENLPHVALAKRMHERDASSAPRSGQRFGYVVVNDCSRIQELYAKSEDPGYAFENKLPLDYLFYLNNQVRKPITSFLSLTGKIRQVDSIFNEIQDALFEKLKKQRNLLQIEAKRQFFNSGKSSLPFVTPLKAPKKQKIKNDKSGVSIKNFFVPKG